MSASLLRIWTIARNTLTEVLRQRVLNIIFLFGVILIGGSEFFSQFAVKEEDQVKFVLNIGYAAISLTGLLVALIGTAQLIPAEIERRTIYTILSKPVRRYEFIVGKYLGLLALLTLMVLLMSGLFYLFFLYKDFTWLAQIRGGAAVLNENQLHQIHLVELRVYDPALLKIVVLVLAELSLVSVIAIFFSTLATSNIFIVATTLMVYLVGHLQGIARDFWLSPGDAKTWKADALGLLAASIPDFGSFNIIDEIIAGHPVPLGYIGQAVTYAGIYTVVLLVVSALIFEDREL